jgi:acyl-CoA synthetase (AMP-forming)/AMP-acid ligase II
MPGAGAAAFDFDTESATPEEIMEFCKDKLAGFKRPKSVVFLDCLPRNQMGKLLRKALREKYGQP